MAEAVGDENPYGLTLYTVQSPTGSDFNLQTKQEAEWYERQRDLYQVHNKFSNVSDLEDLSRLLTLEIMSYRWTTWLTQGFDYIQGRVDETALKNNLREYSTEIRLVKASLGIDRMTREKDKGEDVGSYIATLLSRAKEMGVHRNDQYQFAVTAFFELITQIDFYDRADAAERKEFGLSPESILDWFRTSIMPRWDEMQDAFRAEQKIWISSL